MPTRNIMIQGEQFEVTAPYEAGHQINEAEAKALNQTRLENIRNNIAKVVREAKEAGNLDEARAKVAEYDREYEFTLASTGGGRRTMDPVEREARAIARDAIRAKLSSEGRKLKDVDPEKLEAAIEQVAGQDDVIKLARKRVADKQKVVDASLEGIGLAQEAAE